VECPEIPNMNLGDGKTYIKNSKNISLLVVIKSLSNGGVYDPFCAKI